MQALRERGVALAIGDHPERPFQSHEATADWRFIRFHYGFRGRKRQTIRPRSWRPGRNGLRNGDAAKQIYAYFNNDWSGYAPANARDLLRRLG